MLKTGFGSTSRRGFGFKPRKYGLAAGLQSKGSRTPSYYGAGISGSLLGNTGQSRFADTQSVQQAAPMKPMMLAPDNGGGVAPTAPVAPAQTAPTSPAAQGGWTDPTLGRIMAFNQRNREMARAQATAARKQLAIDYGDASISGDLAGDESTSKAAKGNPFSVLALLRKRYEQDAPRELDESYNNSNLFFSGARAKGLGDLANEYQGQQYDSDRQARGALSQIDNGLLEALMAADYADMNARWDYTGRDGGNTDGTTPTGPGSGNAAIDDLLTGLGDPSGLNANPYYSMNIDAMNSGAFKPYQEPQITEQPYTGQYGQDVGAMYDLTGMQPYGDGYYTDGVYYYSRKQVVNGTPQGRRMGKVGS